MIWIVLGLVFLCVVAFFVVMIFWPEWVGISGADHARVEAEHKGDVQDGPKSDQAANQPLNLKSETHE